MSRLTPPAPPLLVLLLVAHSAACAGESFDGLSPEPKDKGQPADVISNAADANADAGSAQAAEDGSTPEPIWVSMAGVPVEGAGHPTDGVGPASGESDMGSRRRPFASIELAIAAAAARGRSQVNVCTGVYGERVTLLEGVSVTGSLPCRRIVDASEPRRSHVRAPSSPAAMSHDVASPTLVAHIDFDAPDAATPSGSSLALLAVRSPGLQFSDVHFVAGRGATGKDGSPPLQLLDAAAKDAQGIVRGTNACVGAVGREGGVGGEGGWGGGWRVIAGGDVAPDRRTPRTDGSPQPSATNETALGGTLTAAPKSGANGAQGTNGASASSFGAFAEAGFFPGDGAPGTDGAPGQGGGGGAGNPPDPRDVHALPVGAHVDGVDGGGGGAGGCPGLAGAGGRGGGGSIGIVAFESGMTLDGDIVIDTSDGGAAGRGSLASRPTTGGHGGAPARPGGQRGADGGDGGSGGGGGNGAGGPSVGIAAHGRFPRVLRALTVRVGNGGRGAAANPPILASPAGIAATTYVF